MSNRLSKLRRIVAPAHQRSGTPLAQLNNASLAHLAAFETSSTAGEFSRPSVTAQARTLTHFRFAQCKGLAMRRRLTLLLDLTFRHISPSWSGQAGGATRVVYKLHGIYA
eukprot:TRINITY_DN11715_c0_g1_i11.p4 TRINITY_DN11715_c0_g1~~TRINITY_DN11715_c0_g1_i11.p4  ORF type:complete len:110 (+),score=0.70 TRINITY_DN11715_c0_g1_i11:1833-2162(+)